MKTATSKKPTKASKQNDVKKNLSPEKPVKKFDDDDDDDVTDLEPQEEEFNESLGFDDEDDDDF